MEKDLKIFDCELDEEGQLGLTAISVVDFPAIESTFVALKAQKPNERSIIHLKAAPQEERRMLYGAVLIPDKLIFRQDDTEPDGYYIRMSSDTITRCMELYMKKHLQQSATVMHEVPVLGLTTIESWQKMGESDKSVELGIVEPVGTWFIGMKCEDDAVWNEVKAGKFTGFSVEAFFKHADSEESIVQQIEQLVHEALK